MELDGFQALMSKEEPRSGWADTTQICISSMAIRTCFKENYIFIILITTMMSDPHLMQFLFRKNVTHIGLELIILITNQLITSTTWMPCPLIKQFRLWNWYWHLIFTIIT